MKRELNKRLENYEIIDKPVEGQRVFRLLNANCHSCGKQLNTWDARLSKVLKYKNPICESCISKEYDMTADELRDTMKEHFGIIPCQGI